MVYKRCQLKAMARSIQVDVGDADGDGDGDCLPLGRLLNGLSWRRERICPRQSRCGAQCQWVLVVIVARCHLFSGASEAQAVGVQLPKLTCFLPIILVFLFRLNGFAAARGTCHLPLATYDRRRLHRNRNRKFMFMIRLSTSCVISWLWIESAWVSTWAAWFVSIGAGSIPVKAGCQESHKCCQICQQ